MTVFLTHLIVFLAGIAVMRHYRDDKSMNEMADCLVTLIAFPMGLARGLIATYGPKVKSLTTPTEPPAEVKPKKNSESKS